MTTHPTRAQTRSRWTPAAGAARRTLGITSAGTFLALALFTTPMTAMPTLAAALRAGPGAQTWILSSMSVGLAAGLLAFGALGDEHGRRRVFLAGALLVALSTAIGAAAEAAPLFVVARIGQGLGASALIACGLGLVAQAFPAGARRARATGMWGASVGAGIACGPPLSAGLGPVLGWRAPYALLAAAAVALAGVGRLLLAESRPGRPRPVDLPGTALLGLALSALLAGLVAGRESWSGPSTVFPLAAAAALLAGFVLVERGRQRQGRAPLVDSALFRRPEFVAATAAALATGLGVIAAMSFLPTVLERRMGASPLGAALALEVWSGISVPAALAARRLRLGGNAALALGLLVVAAGTVLLAGPHLGGGLPGLLPGLAVAGLGSGVLNAALGRQAVASVPLDQAGVGSGVNNTARYLGSAVGVSVVGLLAARPGVGTPLAGWNTAVIVCAGLSVLGAAVVAASGLRDRWIRGDDDPVALPGTVRLDATRAPAMPVRDCG
jgi:MFS family permease